MLHNTQVRTANGVLYQCTVHEVPTEEEELSLTRPIGMQFANPGGEGYSKVFLVGVCRPALQILTLFQNKKCNFRPQVTQAHYLSRMGFIKSPISYNMKKTYGAKFRPGILLENGNKKDETYHVASCCCSQSRGGGGTRVLFWEGICAARDSKLPPRSKKNSPKIDTPF